MEAEFINVYISKQKNWIEDLLAKHIMMESRLQVAEQKLGEKNKEVESLNITIEEKNKYINTLVQANNDKQREISELVAARQRDSLLAAAQQQPEVKTKKKKTEESVSADEF